MDTNVKNLCFELCANVGVMFEHSYYTLSSTRCQNAPCRRLPCIIMCKQYRVQDYYYCTSQQCDIIHEHQRHPATCILSYITEYALHIHQHANSKPVHRNYNYNAIPRPHPQEGKENQRDVSESGDTVHKEESQEKATYGQGDMLSMQVLSPVILEWIPK